MTGVWTTASRLGILMYSSVMPDHGGGVVAVSELLVTQQALYLHYDNRTRKEILYIGYGGDHNAFMKIKYNYDLPCFEQPIQNVPRQEKSSSFWVAPW